MGSFPTDPKNNNWAYDILDNTGGFNQQGEKPYGIATWYQLCSRRTGYTSNFSNPPTGFAFNPPFVYFPSISGADLLGRTEDQNIADPNYTRTINMVRKPSVQVMIAEAGDPDWVSQSPAPLVKGKFQYARMLGARHGHKTTNGLNAYTNFAFFDGHVALFPTEPIDYNDGATNPAGAGQGGCSAMPISSGTTFSLFHNAR
jgi:prepilin-type processing-associated H-X9-DG protein